MRSRSGCTRSKKVSTTRPKLTKRPPGRITGDIEMTNFLLGAFIGIVLMACCIWLYSHGIEQAIKMFDEQADWDY